MRQTGRGKRKTGRKKYTYEKPHTAAEYRRRRRQQQVRIQRMLLLLGIALVVIFIFVLGGKLLRWIRGKHLAAADVPAAITKVVENMAVEPAVSEGGTGHPAGGSAGL